MASFDPQSSLRACGLAAVVFSLALSPTLAGARADGAASASHPSDTPPSTASTLAVPASSWHLPTDSPDGTPLKDAADLPHTVDYTLSASLDPVAHVITGKGTIRFVNTSSAPLYELWLHLYLNAFKNASSRFLREPIGPFRGGGSYKNVGGDRRHTIRRS